MDSPLREQGAYVFGPFRLDPIRRSLVSGGRRIELTARLFDALLYLVQNHDRLVERHELTRAIWGDRLVEEGNLQKTVSQIRQVLQAGGASDAYIVTVSGRGFRFASPVVFETAQINAALMEADHGAPLHQAERARIHPRSRRMLVGGLALLLAALGLWHFAKHATPSTPVAWAPPPHSLAVLAFSNLSGDPAQEYFSDGLSEEMIDALGQASELRVAARLSSFSFKGQHLAVADIARQLNVGAVLEGSVRRDGARLRVTAQLIDALTGYQIWSIHYDRSPDDVLRVQADIAAAVLKSLQVTLVGDDAMHVSVGGTDNPKAFYAYLRGMKFHNLRTAEAIHQARASFDEALALDPHYALAHVRRASCLILITEGAAEREPGDGDDSAIIAEALAEGRRAIALAPSLGAAHTIVGNALLFSRDLAGAAREHADGIALAPSDAWVNAMYGFSQALLRHYDTAIAAARRGTELDPLSMEPYLNFAQILIYARRPQESLAALDRAVQLGLVGEQERFVRGSAQLQSGDLEAVVHTCAAASDQSCLELRAIAYQALGQSREAEAQLKMLHALSGDSNWMVYVCIYAQWGKIDEALRWLQAAYDHHDSNLIDIRAIWLYDPLRHTPQFKEVERRLDFPPI